MPLSAQSQLSLKEHPFARNLAVAQVATLEALATEYSLPAGEYFWRQGQRDEDIYLIFSGQAALEISLPNQGPLQIEKVGGGDMLGWTWLLPPHRSYLDARALTPVRALWLPGRILRELCEQDQVLGYRVFKAFSELVAERLETVRLRLLELYEPTQRRRSPNPE
jgi:CRP-like cAMP-binding protein